MANRTIAMTDAIADYLVRVAVDEPEVMARLREETSALPNARMQIAPEQGAFMGWLARTIGARRAIEIGTYTGYSALSVARALPADGRLVCCDVSEEYTKIARRYFAEAGLADRIELRIAPAIETLDAMIAAGEAGSYDFAFIDADKPSYDAYYERCLVLLRPGGVIAIDNVLWSSRVADPSVIDESTSALRALNEKVARDARVDACIVPIGDGLTLARKR
ncbi:MAG TPA: class I SAM-dependent methyltransferase [Sandaracinaceae bacterium]